MPSDYFIVMGLKGHLDSQNWEGMANLASEWIRAFGALPNEAKIIAREAGTNLIPLKKEGMILYKINDGEYGVVNV